jgi:hypothetical protein
VAELRQDTTAEELQVAVVVQTRVELHLQILQWVAVVVQPLPEVQKLQVVLGTVLNTQAEMVVAVEMMREAEVAAGVTSAVAVEIPDGPQTVAVAVARAT